MKLENEFEIDAPAENVWDFFHDIPALASCLPGAIYSGVGEDGKHKGVMSVKIGPFNAAFEGVSEVEYRADEQVVVVIGQGVDKKGASRGKMKMTCQMTERDGKTHVQALSDVQISGTIAQFGRTGMIQEVTKVLIADFVKNAEARLNGAVSAEANGETVNTSGASQVAQTPSSETSLSGIGLMMRVLKGWLGSLFSGR